MKNLKNKVATLGLAAVMGFGAVSANAGLMISDRGNTGGCGSVRTSVFTQLSGIIVGGLPMLDGAIILGRDGLMVSDRQNCEASRDGAIILGRDGLMVSD